MKDTLFDTVEKREDAIKLFTELLDHPGWKLFVKIKEINIENLRSALEDAENEHSPEEDNLIREKIKIHRKDISLPGDMIRDFRDPVVDGIDPDLDPYDRVKVKPPEQSSV